MHRIALWQQNLNPKKVCECFKAVATTGFSNIHITNTGRRENTLIVQNELYSSTELENTIPKVWPMHIVSYRINSKLEYVHCLE